MLLLCVYVGGSASSGEGSSGSKKAEGGEGEESAEDREAAAPDGDATRPGAKPQLRVYIPGQKEFVPKTVSKYCLCSSVVKVYSTVTLQCQRSCKLTKHLQSINSFSTLGI